MSSLNQHVEESRTNSVSTKTKLLTAIEDRLAELDAAPDLNSRVGLLKELAEAYDLVVHSKA